MILEPFKIKVDLEDGIYMLDLGGTSSELGAEVWLCFDRESLDLYKYGSKAEVCGFYSRCSDAFFQVGSNAEVEAMSIAVWVGSLQSLNAAISANSLAPCKLDELEIRPTGDCLNNSLSIAGS